MKTLKIQLSILTQGTIRQELALKLIQWLRKTTHNISIEFCSERPVENNRNQIAKRFLQSDCSYLLQCDEDTVPSKNPLDLVELNKDVIVLPTLISKKEHVFYNIYKTDKEGYWIPVQKKRGLIPIDAGGTGCILIHRRVLEKIKAPFERKYDKDGIAILGQDLFFSQKVQEQGFQMFTDFDYECSHYKTIKLCQNI